jgi:adenosylcobinamide-GDP ribazoletransferase
MGRYWPQSAILPALPVLGLGLGLALGMVLVLAHWLGAGPLLGACLAVLASVLLTGALHEDGLADTADGLGPALLDAGRRLEIMRDSRIGAFGACALVLSLAIRMAALAQLAPGTALLSLVAAHALSRAALGWPMLQLAPARTDGLAASQGRPGEADVWLTLAIGVAIAFLFLIARAPLASILAPVAAGAAMLLCTSAMRRGIGGHTGDTLGATQQVVEIVVLVVCALVVARPG